MIEPTWLAYSVSIHALLSRFGTLTRSTPPESCPKRVRLTQFRKPSGLSVTSRCCLICSQGFIEKALAHHQKHSFHTAFPQGSEIRTSRSIQEWKGRNAAYSARSCPRTE